jgi:hypothetical protein
VATPRSGFPAGPYREEYGYDMDHFPILYPEQLNLYQKARGEAISTTASIQGSDVQEKPQPFAPSTDSAATLIPKIEPTPSLSGEVDEVERMWRIQEKLAGAAGKKPASTHPTSESP